MIIKQLETKEEQSSMTSMSASSDAQNQQLKIFLNEKVVQNSDCFIMKEKERVVARVVLVHSHLAFLTFDDEVKQKDADNFIHYIVDTRAMENIRVHLYSDKINYEVTYKSLIHNAFKVIQTKKSHIIKPMKQDIKIEYASLQNKDDEFISIFEQVTKDNLDKDILYDVEMFGVHEASKKMYESLKETSFEADLWLYGLVDNQIVGFVIVTRNDVDTAGIGYIGVLPQYRGHGYAKELLKMAIEVSYQKDVKELVADTDVENVPMLHALLDAGFEISCMETVFTHK